MANGRFINTSAVKFTPAGGSAQTITKVTSINFDMGGQMISAKGDANLFAVHMARVGSVPTATIETEHMAMINTLDGAKGAFEFVSEDADAGNTAAGGAVKYAVANAVITDATRRFPHAQYASGTLRVGCYSTDGSTSPIAVTAV
jgi:hypothetical protein